MLITITILIKKIHPRKARKLILVSSLFSCILLAGVLSWGSRCQQREQWGRHSWADAVKQRLASAAYLSVSWGEWHRRWDCVQSHALVPPGAAHLFSSHSVLVLAVSPQFLTHWPVKNTTYHLRESFLILSHSLVWKRTGQGEPTSTRPNPEHTPTCRLFSCKAPFGRKWW